MRISSPPLGVQSLIWPRRVCGAEQGVVSGSRVLNRLYNLTIERLEQGVLIDR